MHMSLHIQVNAVLGEQRFKGILTGSAYIGCINPDIPRTMETNDDPRRLVAINASQVLFKPFVLLVRISEGTVICSCVCASCFVRGLKSLGKVSFRIEGNKMSEAIVKRVPEIAVSSRLVGRHSEVIN